MTTARSCWCTAASSSTSDPTGGTMRRTTIPAWLAVILATLPAAGCQARPGEQQAVGQQQHAQDNARALRPVGSVPLPGVEGRFDHFAADADAKRLYVAALGNNTMEVIG